MCCKHNERIEKYEWEEKGRNLTSTLNTTISPARIGSLPMCKSKMSPWNEKWFSFIQRIQVIKQTEVTVVTYQKKGRRTVLLRM